jgi:ATP-dependent DNA ligase
VALDPSSAPTGFARIKAWQEVVENEYDGLIAKDNNAPYVGGRTLSWLKVLRPEWRAVIARRFGREK